MLRDLDPVSDRAAFRQIADHIREEITSGRLAPGDRVPSESALMEHYNVSRITVRQALSLLRSEGLTVAEHGRGVFVRQRPPVRRLASDRFARRHREQGRSAFDAEVSGEGRTPSVDRIQISEGDPPADVVERLRLEKDVKVLVRSRRYLVDDRPVETAVSYVPLAIAKDTPIAQPNPGPGGIYARLEDLGYRLERFTEDVTARMPTAEETHALQIPPGTPVISLVRTAFAEGDRPVEVCDTVMVADAFVLGYELPAR